MNDLCGFCGHHFDIHLFEDPKRPDEANGSEFFCSVEDCFCSFVVIA